MISIILKKETKSENPHTNPHTLNSHFFSMYIISVDYDGLFTNRGGVLYLCVCVSVCSFSCYILRTKIPILDWG